MSSLSVVRAAEMYRAGLGRLFTKAQCGGSLFAGRASGVMSLAGGAHQWSSIGQVRAHRRGGRGETDPVHDEARMLEMPEVLAASGFSVLQSRLLDWVARYQGLCDCVPTVEQVLWHSPFEDGLALRYAVACLFMEGWLALPFSRMETRRLLFGPNFNDAEGLLWGRSEGVCCQLNEVPVMVMRDRSHLSTGTPWGFRVEGHLSLPNRLFHCKPDFLMNLSDYDLRAKRTRDGDLGAFIRRTHAHEGQIVLACVQGQMMVCSMGEKQAEGWIVLLNDFAGGANRGEPERGLLRIKSSECQIEGILIGVVKRALAPVPPNSARH